MIVKRTQKAIMRSRRRLQYPPKTKRPDIRDVPIDLTWGPATEVSLSKTAKDVIGWRPLNSKSKTQK